VSDQGGSRPEPTSRRGPAAAGLIALVIVLVAAAAFAAGRRSRGAQAAPPASTSPSTGTNTEAPSSASPNPSTSASPTSAQTNDLYAGIEQDTLAPQVAHVPVRVYVPNNGTNDVSVIDPATFKVIYTFPVGRDPQHITPSWDMKHLYVDNVYSNTLTEVDPMTGRPVRTISIPDPYNLYFTPDGSQAIDVAERLSLVLFYDPHTWQLKATVHIPWAGADHLDFSADGSYFLLSAEYSGRVMKIDVARHKIVASLAVGGSAVDVKVSPDGKVFYVANQIRGGVSVIDPGSMREVAFITTGSGAHGMAVSRNTNDLYVSNRIAGSISVISFATRNVIHTWKVGGSPDMLQVSADGTQLWASNRFNDSVSVIDTTNGKVLHVIKVGKQPHGLTLFPQPGNYCLGHNGVYR
jgi:YVTN family beta-propeller protein